MHKYWPISTVPNWQRNNPKERYIVYQKLKKHAAKDISLGF